MGEAKDPSKESPQQHLTFVGRDGALGFTYDSGNIGDIVGLNNLLVASTYDPSDGRVGIAVFDQKMNSLSSLKLGPSDGSLWRIKLAQGGDGRTFGVSFHGEATSDDMLQFAVVDYR